MEDKQKQIEEMAEFIHVDSSFPGFEEDALRLAEELYKAGYRKHTKHVVPRAEVAKAILEDAVEVVRCKDCDVPHNRWTGCPNLNGMIPPQDFYCAKGERKQKTDDVPDISVGDKPSCKVCEKITEANKDIFWVFARTHQPGTREEFLQIPYEETRFCPVCGREITKEGADGGQ